MSSELGFDRGRRDERIPIPKHVPSREEDFWPDTFWENTENVWNNPTLIAARHLARGGFGISLEHPFDIHGNPLGPERIAIHVATLDDRKALNILDDSEQVRNLRRSIYAGATRSRIPEDQITWYENAEKVIQQAIEGLKLKPKVSLAERLKRKLRRK